MTKYVGNNGYASVPQSQVMENVFCAEGGGRTDAPEFDIHLCISCFRWFSLWAFVRFWCVI